MAKLRKEDEIRFTAGESFVRSSLGFDAPPPVAMEIDGDATEEEELAALLDRGTDIVSFADPIEDLSTPSSLIKVLEDVTRLCYNERPHTRYGGCVFLVTFLRLVGSPHATKEKVEYTFLSDKDVNVFVHAQEQIAKTLPGTQQPF
jgi:hypothetical protein